MLVVVMGPTADMETEFTAQYLAFPELHDPSEHLTQPLIDAFPASVGLSLQDSTFSALKKIHTSLGMAAMHPKA
jgi:mRNA deadenylase 3'-5' endonuclease subunit Ccr4